MSLFTPVVGEIALRVLDHPDADCSKLPGTPKRFARCAGMFGRRDGGPVCRAEGDVIDLHEDLLRLGL